MRAASREIVRTSQANRPFSSLIFFVRKKNTGDNTKLWGRLTPNARFALQKIRNLSFFHGFDSGTGSERVRTSQAKRLFSLFDFCFFFHRKNSGENAKLWGRLKRNACFPQKKSKYFPFLDTFENEIVRTSQAKHPFMKRNDRFYDRVGPQNCEDVSSDTSVYWIFETDKKTARRRNCEDVSAQTPVLEKSDPFSFNFSSICARSKPRNGEDVSGKSLIFVFDFCFVERKTPEITRNCEDVSRQTPVLPFKNSEIYYFSRIWPRNRQRKSEDVSSQRAIFAFWFLFFFS